MDFATCPWYWLWLLVGWLISSFLTWLLTRRKKEDNTALIAERDRYHAAATKWETDYQSLKYQLEESQKAEADLRSALQLCEADKSTLKYQLDQAATAAAGFVAGRATADGDDDAGDDGADTDALGIMNAGEGSTPDDYETNAIVIPAAGLGEDEGNGNASIYAGLFQQDNFQIIEGIGPKVNQVLINAGYNTWSELSQADPTDLRRILDEAGKNFKLCDPTTWPHQAGLAAAGDWDELIRYQKFTDGGRETTGSMQSDSKFEKLAAKALGFSSNDPNDLKVVEGIGPKIEGLLKAAGIMTWQELSETDLERIQSILNEAGPRYKLAAPRTWPEQAALAAAGRWKELKTLQDHLQGGK